MISNYDSDGPRNSSSGAMLPTFAQSTSANVYAALPPQDQNLVDMNVAQAEMVQERVVSHGPMSVVTKSAPRKLYADSPGKLRLRTEVSELQQQLQQVNADAQDAVQYNRDIAKEEAVRFCRQQHAAFERCATEYEDECKTLALLEKHRLEALARHEVSQTDQQVRKVLQEFYLP